MRETIKKGTHEWWTWIAMLHAAERERKRFKLPPTTPVTIDVKLCNDFIDSINRNPLKRLYLLLTNGDMHPLERDKIGDEVSVKAEDGVVSNFFRKEIKRMQSGIYAKFGAENKDVITEATAQEFKDWLAIRGLNISFMSDDTLNGFIMGRQEPFRQWEMRTAFIRDAEANGITVYKVRDDWEAFKAAYEEEVQRRYG